MQKKEVAKIEIKFNREIKESDLPLISIGGFELKCGEESIKFDYLIHEKSYDGNRISFTLYEADNESFPNMNKLHDILSNEENDFKLEESYVTINDSLKDDIYPVAISMFSFYFYSIDNKFKNSISFTNIEEYSLSYKHVSSINNKWQKELFIV